MLMVNLFRTYFLEWLGDKKALYNSTSTFSIQFTIDTGARCAV